MVLAVRRHWRKLSFAFVGASGVMLSYLILVVGVEYAGMSRQVAYITQMVVVIEYNFVLSYYMTWKDRRDISIGAAWCRFHASRMVTIALNQVLFGVLVLVGVHYLLANTVCVALVSIINYIAGDRVIFCKRVVDVTVGDGLAVGDKPKASIVIPVKNNGDTIRATVESLLRQDYAGSYEIILVGSIGDTTWSGLTGLLDGKTVHAYELDVVSPGRDANAKRSYGLSVATGEVLAVVDSDMVMGADWLDKVVDHMRGGYSAVAGSVQGLGNSFWARYIDQNPVAPKTPRITGFSVLDRKNLRRKKPPVTANFACSRAVYERVGGPNPSFTNSYEDYEWFSRIVRAGYRIVLDEQLNGERYHREGFKPLLREYFRSGKGCADHIVTHPGCGFAQTRLVQLALTVSAIGTGLICLWLYPALVVLVCLASLCVLTARSVSKVGRFEAVAYPMLSLIFALAFVCGNLARFLKRGWAKTVAPTVHRVRPVVFELNLEEVS